MFIDYYAILEISMEANPEDIKAAFKKQAFRWHPDRNLGIDTTSKMQDINEANLILLDLEARERYNIEYLRFKDFQNRRAEQEVENNYSDYKVEDEVLNKWMSNAKKQAVDITKETIEDLKGMTIEGMKSVTEKIGSQFPSLLISALALLVIGLIIKACN